MKSFEPIDRYNRALRDHHDLLYNQRIEALHNGLRLLSANASGLLNVINATRRAHISDIELSLIYVKYEINRIKIHMQTIRKCNHQFLLIQPILVDDDINRYLHFMVVSYRQVSKDIVKLSVFMENAAFEYQSKVDEILGCEQSRKPSAITRILHFINK